jgi:Flp pilus assembly protein TadD
MGESNPLSNIHYISIDSLNTRSIGDFTLDPAVRLPVELPAGLEDWKPSNISWEAIISAMLKVLAYDGENEQTDYYRRFVLAVNPQIKEEFTQAGILKSKQGELDLAIEIFRALVGLFPDCASSRNNLALVYEEKARSLQSSGLQEDGEKYEELAFSQYKQALSADPQSAVSHFNFAHFYLRRRSLDKARQHFDSFLSLNRDPQKAAGIERLRGELDALQRIEATCAEAYDAIKIGREQQAIEKIRPLLEEHPRIWNAWFLLGWAERRSGKFAEASQSLQKAVDLEPNNPDTLNELAICLMELGEIERSRTRLLEALRIEPDNVKLISNLGILSLKSGDKEKASELFRRVLTREPGDPLALHYLEILAPGR